MHTIQARHALLKTLKWQAILSSFLTYLALCILAWYITPLNFLNNFFDFLGGNIHIAQEKSVSVMIQELIGMLVIRIPIFIILISLMQKWLGKVKSNTSLFHYGDKANFWLGRLLLVVTVEEIFARVLFLTILPELFNVTSTYGLWAFLITGNALWSWQHLSNFNKRKERKIGYVLTQFVGGFFYAYFYLKFGLLATVLLHFGFNGILFASRKGALTPGPRGLKILITLLFAGIAYQLLGKDYHDVLLWVKAEKITPLPGWRFIDYLALLLTVSSVMTAIFTLLHYDDAGKEDKNSLGRRTITYLIAQVLLLLMIYGATYLLQSTASAYLCSVFAYLLIVSAVKGQSPNHAIRMFWETLTIGWLLVCATMALPWLSGLFLLAYYFIVAMAMNLLLENLPKRFPKEKVQEPLMQRFNEKRIAAMAMSVIRTKKRK